MRLTTVTHTITCDIEIENITLLEDTILVFLKDSPQFLQQACSIPWQVSLEQAQAALENLVQKRLALQKDQFEVCQRAANMFRISKTTGTGFTAEDRELLLKEKEDGSGI